MPMRAHVPWRRLALVLAGGVAVATSGLFAIEPVTATAKTATYLPVSLRQRVDLGDGWRFLRADTPDAQNPGFDDSTWSDVTVPHTWNAQDGQDGGNNYYRGVGWYRLHLTPPKALSGKQFWLQFDGANTVTDVWLNGAHLGQHKGGYARFRFDATAALKPDTDNVIAVKVNNVRDNDVAPLTADFTFFGGLYRKVALVATDPLSVRMLDYAGPGVYLRQHDVSAKSATVDVTTEVSNNSPAARTVTVRTVVTDAANLLVTSMTSTPVSVAAKKDIVTAQTVTITNPRRWQGKTDPYLYKVTVEIRDTATGVVTDTVTEPLGLRSISVDPMQGLFLNGTHLMVHGVNRHQDVLDRGTAISDADDVRDFNLMDEMGANALRTAHYQQDPKVYDLADHRGYLVWTEIPLVNTVSDNPRFRANAVQQLRELIRQNYNHPSVAFWGIGNEQGGDNAATNDLLDTLGAVAAAEDPDRLSSYAHNGGITSGLLDHTDVDGYNKYFGWYHDSIPDLGPYLDDLHSRQPDRRIGLSEYGAGASVLHHQEDPAKPAPAGNFHPEEYQALLHESQWAQITARPYLWGTFIWNMFDFASDLRTEGDTNGRNDKGLVTYDRLTRKDAFYWYKANWTNTPFVYLTSRRWIDRTVPKTTIKVYGDVDSVVLKVNGVALGPAKVSGNHIYRWLDVTLQPGTNTIEATGTRDGVSYTDSVIWVLRSNL
jgi:beta-galactosidase